MNNKYIVLTVPHSGPSFSIENSEHFQDHKSLNLKLNWQ